MRERGFASLLSRCITRPPIHAPRECLRKSCPGCEKHTSSSELYIPAPQSSTLDAIFDYHITTRNFFAWLYHLPLAGRALGVSLVALKDRIEFYRNVTDDANTKKEIVEFAESQRYLDFRECLDHALAILVLAESLDEQDLWIDAFAHCVGMSHRSICSSLEYSVRYLFFSSLHDVLINLCRRSAQTLEI